MGNEIGEGSREEVDRGKGGRAKRVRELCERERE